MQSYWDETALVAALSNVTPRLRLSFGSACATRMFPMYEAFSTEQGWSDPTPRATLDFLWSACSHIQGKRRTAASMIAACEACIPDSDDYVSELCGGAQYALIALCVLLEAINDGQVEQIVRVVRLAIDSADRIVQDIEDMRPLDPAREQRILSHPLMQQELARQARDVAEVVSGGSNLVARVKERAESESILRSGRLP